MSCGTTGVPEKFNWRGNLIPDAYGPTDVTLETTCFTF